MSNQRFYMHALLKEHLATSQNRTWAGILYLPSMKRYPVAALSPLLYRANRRRKSSPFP